MRYKYNELSELGKLVNDLGNKFIQDESKGGFSTLNRRVKKCGIAALATQCDVSQHTVMGWMQRGFMPADQALRIQGKYNGKYKAEKLSCRSTDI